MSEAKAWWLYILECADGSLYTGITNDLDRRLNAHNRGVASRYTRARVPVALRYQEAQLDRSVASKREAQVKRMTRTEKVALIEAARSVVRKRPRRTLKRKARPAS